MDEADKEIQMILERQNQKNQVPSSGDPEIDAILQAQEKSRSLQPQTKLFSNAAICAFIASISSLKFFICFYFLL